MRTDRATIRNAEVAARGIVLAASRPAERMTIVSSAQVMAASSYVFVLCHVHVEARNV